MDKDVLIALIGFLTATIGGVRWLIHVYIKQENKIEDLRSKNEKASIAIMKDMIQDLKRELSFHSKNLKDVETRMNLYMKKSDEANQDQRVILESMKMFIDTTMKRMQVVESRIVDLANGLLIIKGGNGKT